MDLPPLDPTVAHDLRAEALGMAEAYVTALSSASGDGAIEGVYLKGSSCRSWDSAIDYVPELSDVDIHVRLAEHAESLSRSFDFSMEVAEGALAEYARRFPSPRHTPRPQLMFLKELEGAVGYLPSTAGSVRTLMGRAYQVGTEAAYSDTSSSDADRFLLDADFVLRELAGKVIDRPGRWLWHLVSRLTFRVAPAGPRLLTQLGVEPYRAWSLNRTEIVRELEARGHGDVGGHYADFYLAGWRGFESSFSKHGPARDALEAGYRLYVRGSQLVHGVRGESRSG